MRRAPLLAWLLAVWLTMWRDVSVANVLSGLVVAAVVTASFGHPPAGERAIRLRPLAAMRFLAHFVRKLVESTIVVAWEVLTPTNQLVEGVIAAPVRGWSPLATAITANAISLTPGTITLDVAPDGRTLYVHVLHLRDADLVRAEILHVESLVVAALGGDLELAA